MHQNVNDTTPIHFVDPHGDTEIRKRISELTVQYYAKANASGGRTDPPGMAFMDELGFVYVDPHGDTEIRNRLAAMAAKLGKEKEADAQGIASQKPKRFNAAALPFRTRKRLYS